MDRGNDKEKLLDDANDDMIEIQFEDEKTSSVTPNKTVQKAAGMNANNAGSFEMVDFNNRSGGQQALGGNATTTNQSGNMYGNNQPALARSSTGGNMAYPGLNNNNSNSVQNGGGAHFNPGAQVNLGGNGPNRCLEINCSRCTLLLTYQPGAYMVQCPICLSLTAVQALNRLVCGVCYREIVYPAGSQLVRCGCGVVNRTPVIQPQMGVQRSQTTNFNSGNQDMSGNNTGSTLSAGGSSSGANQGSNPKNEGLF